MNSKKWRTKLGKKPKGRSRNLPTKNEKEILVPRSEKYDNIKFWIEYGVDIDKRRVMLDEDVDEYSIGWIIRGIRKMTDKDDESPIDVYVNSFGGSIYDGLALFDFLESLDYLTVRTHALGKIMSMAFILYMVGDERYSYPRARFMNHEGWDLIEGKTSSIKNSLKELEELDKVCNEILGERTNKDAAWWKKSGMYLDRYYDKETAKTLGVVTHEYPKHEEIEEDEE